ncbi:MAG TPA: DUF29 domain-containing protein, partial [Caldilineaceae bacterium]|nr:DUF29 domain-containing protein [Caldilineaceae bacterium]
LAHLLKWQYQPEHRSRSWEVTIQLQRSEIADLLADNPSLRPQWSTFVERARPKARKIAWGETGLDLTLFPLVSPYTQEQLLDESYLPGASAPHRPTI